MLSALLFFLSAHIDLTAIHVSFGPQAFLSWLLPLMLVLCGLLLWLTPPQRIFYGVIGAAVSVYGLIGLNLGGFFVGMILGMVGGALGASWSPVAVPPVGTAAGTVPDDAPAEGDPDDATVPDPEASGFAGDTVTDLEPVPTTSPLGAPPARTAPAAQEPTPSHRAATAGATALRPASGAPDVEPDAGEVTGPLPRRTPRLLGITLLAAATATTGLLIAQRPQPAMAEQPCATASASATATTTGGAASPTTGDPTTGSTKAESPTASPTPTTPSPSPSATDENLLNKILDGLGKLIGIGGSTTTASPTPSPTAKAAAAAPAAGTTTQAAGAKSTSGATKTGKVPAAAAASPTPTCANASPSASVNPNLNKTAAADPGQPKVNLTPSKQITALLSQAGLSYDGVVELPTATGTIRVLKFSLDSSTSTPFELQVPVNGHTLSIRSSQLTVSRSDDASVATPVEFFTSEIKGYLLGLVPVDFTPDNPPPLVLPVLFFTDATVQLVFVKSDKLTAPGLSITYIS
jgi:hypothetical protein